ncbi:uncharacterized protein LOC115625717 [Scaptodrosophila lebanonensis]|uniref:Uncharacterized protein LOC115625717 n=1 Tax=Drosophila lebanonensis TaxID=7225 RepID=A0A6J2TNN0_DROLE|nr:uncharacterized protein LOC115625717 [Scaptodrosophila lebanonensis]
MNRLEFVLSLVVVGIVLVLAKSEQALPLNAKDFQLQFLQSIADVAEQRAELSLNAYLQELADTGRYGNYSAELAAAKQTHKLQAKVVLIKQLLDARAVAGSVEEDLEHTSMLRNLVFLRKLKQQMREMHEASAQEIRQLRLHRLCKQFERPAGGSPSGGSRLINEQTLKAALEQLNSTKSNSTLELNKFGQDLYERVKVNGAQIIDNYLQMLRGLIQDILEAGHGNPQLLKVLNDLEEILAIGDLYEKRQRLYDYLERHLMADYEQMNPETKERNLGELLDQLKSKGLDLFVIFLFSNFEFLEHVHEQWVLMLPQTSSLLYDDNTRELYDIQQLYDRFKLDTESAPKYEAYVGALRRLHERTVEQGDQNRHIFELLNNAAQNVGSVTFNMIKAKCKEWL